METLEEQKQAGVEYLRARLRAAAQEREFGRMRTEAVSEDVARLARLASEMPLALADAAREAGVARQSLHEAAGRAAEVEPHDRETFALAYLAAAGASEAGALGRVLGLGEPDLRSLLHDLRTQELTIEMAAGFADPGTDVGYIGLAPAGRERLTAAVRDLRGRVPHRTYSFYFQVLDEERKGLEAAAAAVVGYPRFASFGTELTPISQDVQGPEIAITVNTDHYPTALGIAGELWHELRRTAGLTPVDRPPERLTVSPPAPDPA